LDDGKNKELEICCPEQPKLWRRMGDSAAFLDEYHKQCNKRMDFVIKTKGNAGITSRK